MAIEASISEANSFEATLNPGDVMPGERDFCLRYPMICIEVCSEVPSAQDGLLVVFSFDETAEECHGVSFTFLPSDSPGGEGRTYRIPNDGSYVQVSYTQGDQAGDVRVRTWFSEAPTVTDAVVDATAGAGAGIGLPSDAESGFGDGSLVAILKHCRTTLRRIASRVEDLLEVASRGVVTVLQGRPPWQVLWREAGPVGLVNARVAEVIGRFTVTPFLTDGNTTTNQTLLTIYNATQRDVFVAIRRIVFSESRDTPTGYGMTAQVFRIQGAPTGGTVLTPAEWRPGTVDGDTVCRGMTSADGVVSSVITSTRKGTGYLARAYSGRMITAAGTMGPWVIELIGTRDNSQELLLVPPGEGIAVQVYINSAASNPATQTYNVFCEYELVRLKRGACGGG